MNKKLKYVLVVGLLLTIVATSFLVGCSPVELPDKDKYLAIDSWMSYINDDTLLKSLVIPGSHDTGTWNLSYVSQTQFKDMAEQLACGTRYFDLRYDVVDGELVMYHGVHSILYQKGIMYDKNAILAFTQIKKFMEDHPTETLILDITNIFDEAKELLFKTVHEYLGEFAIVNNTSMSDVDFVDTLTLGECRGKCLILWGSETDAYLDEEVIFKRNDDFGNRTECVLHSFYKKEYNEKYSSEKYIDEALPEYIDMFKEYGKGLFVLQGQLTDGLKIMGPRAREDFHYDNMNKYVLSLADNKEVLDDINIIMRDFVGYCKNSCAIKLNLTKGYVSDQYKSDFEEMTNYYISNDDEEPGIGIPLWIPLAVIALVVLFVLIAVLIVVKRNKANKNQTNANCKQ